ncbi:hypothetical protein GCM10010123_00220 [Pilimelia anulata]|uniref:DNA-binding protein n=1 Tax=Pilimelia anulata TaxID=53371 RepID=A0A8J3FAG2_9ACTN|nr:hypothetical protein [Pilimelia anulata]GGJ74213.1 hypothetical protein GCM10010123_00220 [Pilimelia anulata]
MLEQGRAAYEPAAAGAVYRFGLVLGLPVPSGLFAGIGEPVAAPAGAAVVTVHWPAAGLAAAVTGAVRHAEERGARVWRVLADDWVTAADIGVRVRRSRETVRRWASGRLGPPGFPPPLNPGCGVHYYSWAEVRGWLRGPAGIPVGDEPPVLAAANLALRLRRTIADVPDAGPIWELLWPD